MIATRPFTSSRASSWGLALLLSACASPPTSTTPTATAPQGAPAPTPVKPSPAALATTSAQTADLLHYHWLNRLTWGASSSALAQAAGQDANTMLAKQLAPGPATLPAAAQSQISALTLSQKPFPALMIELEQRRRDADALKNDNDKKAAQQAYQQELNRLAREAASRHVLRALYSPRQLQEQMTWFWLNHFSVFQNKANIRAMVGDYEDSAIRPHALGRFRDLLGAATLHPAMLRYLDNEQNAVNRINENLARELMELHTLGVDGPYSQKDVQELARVLTGAGVNLTNTDTPVGRRELQGYYVRRGVFEFHPGRHDFTAKTLLGQPLQQRGLAELDEALDRLARHPATARFVSRKLAQYWLADSPPPALVERMAQAFMGSDGDIAVTLRTLLSSPEFVQGAGHKFKDPMRYVVSALRLAYDDRVILNTGPVLNWLNRLGQPLYGRQTPDGWPLDENAWASPGQMTVRFEVARAIGSGSAGLFRSEGPAPQEVPAFPQLANALYYQALQHNLGSSTRAALAQAGSPQEWATFLLSSPELMRR
ncbi:MAG: DUF1800 domain-containing protein [Burkholderiales bacterium]|nr:DUF1800 domain-containing protein [Burkholderiales bacterium]